MSYILEPSFVKYIGLHDPYHNSKETARTSFYLLSDLVLSSFAPRLIETETLSSWHFLKSVLCDRQDFIFAMQPPVSGHDARYFADEEQRGEYGEHS